MDNKRVVLVAAPHQSSKDEYLMILIILALDVDVCYLSAKWTMRRIPNPFEKSKDIDGYKKKFLESLEPFLLIEKKTVDNTIL